jgi:hypothetical protein
MIHSSIANSKVSYSFVGASKLKYLEHYFFENERRVPYILPTPFEKPPKLLLARLFWKSRGLK